LKRPAAHLKYRPDVDGLRAIAVLAVVGYHAFPRQAPGGFVGVDIFFVLSGFLISGIILRGLETERFSYVDFYARRIRRIFPALATVLLTCLVAGWFLLLPDQFKELGRQAAAGAAFVANVLFWSEAGYFDAVASSKPLLHLWSLGIEEQFYLVWPLLVALAYRNRRWLPVLGVLLLASFVANVAFVHDRQSAVFYLPFTRFWELLVGAALAYMGLRNREAPTSALREPRKMLTEVMSWAGLALIILSFIVVRSDAFPGWWAVLPVAGTLLLVAAESAWLNRKILSARPLVFIGLISYPLYLWHWVVLSFLSLAYHEFPSRNERIVAVALSVVLACLTYQLIEKPIRFGKRGTRNAYALFASMAAVTVVALLVDISNGAAFRLPQEIRPLAAFSADQQTELADAAYRGDRCFLDLETQTFADIAPECVDKPAGASELVVLWGDSHAASLYPGLRKMLDRAGGFRLAQFTAKACPPVSGMTIENRQGCRRFNDDVLARIRALKPDIVVLEGDWSLYKGHAGWDRLDPAALRATVTELHSGGVGRVVVFGSLPVWTIDQPRVGIKLWEDTHVLSARTYSYLDPSSMRADRTVEAAVEDSPAVFVSPIDLLCNQAGCLISTDKRTPVPVTWDRGHLTPAGSDLLIRLASEPLLERR
jgi:peptidoglycan/LPS O-acetylase OafA/YrhL